MEFAGGRKLVVPGEVIAEGMEYLPGDGTYRLGKKIIASKFGLLDKKGRLFRVIPVSGRYIPKEGDAVIAYVREVRFANWELDINSPYPAILLLGDAVDRFVDLTKESITQFYNTGDVLICKIKLVDESFNVYATMKAPGLRKLREGRIIEVEPTKIPRIIGKNASMIKMIKEYTKSQIFVAQNGRIWINGGNENLAIKAIKKVEAEAHTSGLTDRIKAMLEAEANGEA